MGLIQTSAGAIYFNELLVFQRTGLVPKYRKAFFVRFLGFKRNALLPKCLNAELFEEFNGDKGLVWF